MERQATTTKSPAKAIKSVVYRYPTLVSGILWILIPLAVAVFVGQMLEGIYQRPHYRGIGFVLALLIVAIAWLNRSTLWPAVQQIPNQIKSIDGNWLFVFIAIGLRFAMLQVVPPPFAGFEEMQQGKIAHDIVYYDSHLSFHFLFSNVLSTIGFIYSGHELGDLRLGYEIAGAASILLLAICLRRLNVGWTATIITVMIMASLSWAVTVGGLAEESFGPAILVTSMILLIVLADTSAQNQYFWAGLCGVVVGMLMYEYTPYVFFVPIAPLYWLISARIGSRFKVRRLAVLKGFWFTAAMSVVAAPLIAQFIYEPEITHVGDAFLRHNVYEASDDTGIQGDIEKIQSHFTGYVSTVFGINSDMSSPYFRPSGGSTVPIIVGLLFLSGVLSALYKPKELLPFILAISVPAFLILISMTSFTYYEARLTPLVAILPILAGLALNHAIRFVESRQLTGTRFVPVLIVVATVAIVGINFIGANRLARDEKSLFEYTNNNYTVCRAVAEQPYDFDQLLVIGPVRCEYGDEIWLYPDRVFSATRAEDLPDPSEIAPRTLVLAGNNRGVSVGTFNLVQQMAIDLNSDDTLLEFTTLMNRLAAVTFCRQCQPRAE